MIKALNPDFEAYFLISATGNGSAVTASYCKQIRQKNELSMPVVYDPTGQTVGNLQLGGANHRHVVYTTGMVIQKKQYSGDSGIHSYLKSLLD